MTEISMPRLSDSMEEGTIVRWLRNDGDTVELGDELVEIETDKATILYEAEASGVLTRLAQEGEIVPVGGIIGRLVAVGEAGGASEVAASAVGVPAAPVHSNGPGPDPVTERGRAAPATPLARRIAAERGVDLAHVAGTGPRGRITRADVYATLGLEPPPSAARPARMELAEPPRPVVEADARGVAHYEELTGLQKVVARRMSEAKASIPEFHVQTEVRMDAVLTLRSRLKEQLEPDTVVPSLNDMIVKACALALREHPGANSSWDDGRVAIYPQINIGVAVAAERGLAVPTVMQADTKSLGTIAADTRRLADRVRTRKISPEELSGGTFTVSNLGMFGMTAITPVINPPQAAILGVGSIREVVAREHRRLVDCSLSTLTLTCDHRVLYGAEAARFLSTIRELLEDPVRLLL